MNLLLITFRAFSQEFTEPFLNKGFLEIHKDLSDKCDTYVPLKILQIDLNVGLSGAQEISVDQLLIYKESWENTLRGVPPEQMSQVEYIVEYLKKNFNPPKRKL